MALVVPEAQTPFSPVQTPRLNPNAPNIGDGIGQAADAGLQFVIQKRKTEEDRALRETKLNTLEALDQARFKYETDGNLVGLTDRWQAESQKIAEDAAASLPAHLRRDFALDIRTTVAPQTSEIRYREFALHKDQARADLATRGDRWANAAAKAPSADARAAVFAEADKDFQAQADGGIISREEAGNLSRQLRASTDGTRATELMNEDPAALISAIDAGTIGQDLDPKVRATLKGQAQNAVAAAAKAAETEANRQASLRATAAKEVLRDGAAVYKKGDSAFSRKGEADALLKDPAIAALPEAKEYLFAQTVAQKRPGFEQSSLEAKKAALAAEKAKPKAAGYEADVVAAMEASIAANEKAARDGTLWSYVEGSGFRKIVPLPGPESVPDAPTLAAALRGRAAEAKAAEDAGLTGKAFDGKARPAPLFQPDEKDAFEKAVKWDAPPDERLKVALGLAGMGRTDAERAAKELGASPAFVHASGGVAAGVLSPQTARDVFRGEQAIERGDIKMPPEGDRRGLYFQQFNALLPDGTTPGNGDETKQRERLIATADAIYASKRIGTDPAAAFSETDWIQSLHEAAGGKGQFGDDDATGGVAQLVTDSGPYMTFLPAGISAGEMQGSFANMVRSWTRPAATGEFGRAGEGVTDAQWSAITYKGRTPLIAGQPVDAPTLRRLQFKAVGGTYMAMAYVDPETGSVRPLADAAGLPILIDTTKMIDTFGAGQ